MKKKIDKKNNKWNEIKREKQNLIGGESLCLKAKHDSLRLMNINQNRRVYTSMIPTMSWNIDKKILHIEHWNR